MEARQTPRTGGATPLPMPEVGPPGPPAPLKVDLSWEGREYAVHLLDAGLACCSVEVMAAALDARSARDAGALGHSPAGSPVDVLVVSGTCTDVLAPMLVRIHAEVAPAHVVSFGACSATGGPYWDSYSVTKGVDQVIPVDVVVPGCPPPPEALLEALALLGGSS